MGRIQWGFIRILTYIHECARLFQVRYGLKIELVPCRVRASPPVELEISEKLQ